MSFTGLSFLLLVFPSVLILYLLIPNRTAQNVILLIGSLAFYSWGEPKAVLLLLIVILVNYLLGLWIEHSRSRIVLALGILLDLSVLFLFKYLGFVTVDILHMDNPLPSLVQPLGISFYLFSAISYLADVAQKKTPAEYNLFLFALYMSLFPKLLVGPLISYPVLIDQIRNRKRRPGRMSAGIRRFIAGLGKKVLIANQIAIASNKLFSLPADQLTSPLAWLGAVSFMLQIYYDFSGYSDMAIGLGEILGFDFPENFNYPYLACSIQDFWRRWHMTLSSWFRDYVYIPLGGNRVGKLHWIFNVLAVWALTGLWHGAAWNFILWGLYYGVLLILERLILPKSEKFNFLRWLVTMLVVLYGWVLFNASDLSQIIYYTKAMFSFSGTISRSLLMQLGILYLAPYYIPAVLGIGPWFKKLCFRMENSGWTLWIPNLLSLLLFAACLVFLISNSYLPFIYFKF